MPIRLFNAKRLAEELGRGEVGLKTRVHYLLASILFGIFLGYSGLAQNNNSLGSWLSLYEGIAISIIAFVGILKAYDAAGAETNPDFIAEFTCLSVPVWVTTSLAVWGCYWAIGLGFQDTLVALSESHFQIALNLSKFGADFFNLLSFIAITLGEFIFFFRIVRLFPVVRGQ